MNIKQLKKLSLTLLLLITAAAGAWADAATKYTVQFRANGNTHWSVGALVGLLKDMVNIVREQTLMGNTVKMNKDAILGWTDLAQKLIDDAKQPQP